MNLLENERDRQFGDLTGLILKIPNNELSLLPDELTKNRASGIALEIWSETRVKGDYDQKFNVAQSDISKVWIELTNNTPIFTQPVAKEIDATRETEIKLDKDRVLFKLESMIIDLDKNDVNVISVEIPKELNEFLLFDDTSNEIKIQPKVNSYADLPQGIYQLGVRVRDSSVVLVTLVDLIVEDCSLLSWVIQKKVAQLWDLI